MTIVIVPPAAVLPLAEMKEHLRVDHDDEDGLISLLGVAAQSHLSGPGGWLGRAIGEQTLEERASSQDRCIVLPYPPFISLVSATFLDPDGIEQPLGLDAFVVDPGLCGSAVVSPANEQWPAMAPRPDTLRIRYKAGHLLEDPEFAPIRWAMLMLVSHWYINREAVADGAKSALPMGVENLLMPKRVLLL